MLKFKLQYNGIAYRIYCINTGQLLCLSDETFPDDERPYKLDSGAKSNEVLFKSPKSARKAVKEAYGYRARIFDPDFR